MNTIFVLLRKEFIQIFRNKTMLPIIFVLPIVQLVVLVFAATQEMKQIDVCFVDYDHSVSSRAIISKIQASTFYTTVEFVDEITEAENLIVKDKAELAMIFPNNFGKDLTTQKQAEVQLLINGINGTAASLINAYTQSIIQSFNAGIAVQTGNLNQPDAMKRINTIEAYWYNPEMNYKYYMLPGILVILVTVVGMFLTALNLVREKELGTIEQINVTPIKKYQFIVSKLIPFWLIALFELGFGLFISKLLFDLPMLGSLPLLFLFASVYLILALAIGLFLSTITHTQQQVMFLAWFFVMVFLLMSGLFTPTESMPDWAQKVNFINPMAYFIKVIRMILLKGSEFMDIFRDLVIMFCYGTAMLGVAIWKYRKVV